MINTDTSMVDAKE